MKKRAINKENRMNLVVKAAETCFEERGIESCKMTEIADVAGIGVASLYRYFTTKSDIAIEVGIKYWRSACEKTKAMIDNDLTGLENIDNMLSMYTQATEESYNFFRFIEQFDTFVIKLDKQPMRMEDYETSISELMPVFEGQIIKGQEDQSIRSDIDIKTTITMVHHTLMALKQKHCSRGLVIKSDSLQAQEREVKLLIEIFLSYLRN